MDENGFFTSADLQELEEAVAIGEELVSNYYKMSSTQWLRSRYDIKTRKELSPDEIVEGPFAQVLGYESKRGEHPSYNQYNYYKVCFQDRTILDKISCCPDLMLFPFLVYITVHELVHIVRFSTFQQIYSASSEAQCALEEEKKVHSISSDILKKVSVAGMDNVLEYYKDWL